MLFDNILLVFISLCIIAIIITAVKGSNLSRSPAKKTLFIWLCTVIGGDMLVTIMQGMKPDILIMVFVISIIFSVPVPVLLFLFYRFVIIRIRSPWGRTLLLLVFCYLLAFGVVIFFLDGMEHAMRFSDLPIFIPYFVACLFAVLFAERPWRKREVSVATEAIVDASVNTNNQI